MVNSSGLVFAFELDGAGGGRQLTEDVVTQWQPGKGILWVHLDYTGAMAKDWLQHRSGIDPIMLAALTATETRPRNVVHKDGMLVILRGVNLNPGADPDDMVSVRCWLDPHLIVTLRHRRVMAVDDIRKAVVAGNGPTGPGTFLETLADRLVLRMGDFIATIDDSVDALEDELLTGESYELRPKIADLRRAAIRMRRYLAPQRDVITRLHSEKLDWLGDLERMRLREIADRTTRFVEDLDAVRDRATVTQEELNNRLSEQMNKTMYVLSIVAGMFLPLGFLTGLLGINIAGMPGTDNPLAFTIFCVMLVLVAAAQAYFFKKKKWL